MLRQTVGEHVKDEETDRLVQMFERFSMKQQIIKPTRISTRNTATIIDHIWTDETAMMVKESGTIEGISDHTGQYIKLNLTEEKTEMEKIRYRNYRNYNPENFNCELRNNQITSNFNNLVEEEELDQAMNTWTKCFKETAHKHAPMVEKVRKNKKENVPWFERPLETKIEEKNRKLQLYRLYGNKQDLLLANKIGNVITHMKRKMKKNYYKQKIVEYEGDSKKMWKIFKKCDPNST